MGGEEYTLTIKTLVNGQPVGEISEKKEKESTEEKKEETKEENEEEEEKTTKKETDGRPPIDIFEVQRISKRMRSQNKQVSLEVIDEKAKDSESAEVAEKQSVENTKDKIALNLDDLPKTESLPHLVSARPKRQKTKRGTLKSQESTENAEELKEFEEFFPKIENSAQSGLKDDVV